MTLEKQQQLKCLLAETSSHCGGGWARAQHRGESISSEREAIMFLFLFVLGLIWSRAPHPLACCQRRSHSSEEHSVGTLQLNEPSSLLFFHVVLCFHDNGQLLQHNDFLMEPLSSYSFCLSLFYCFPLFCVSLTSLLGPILWLITLH